MRTRSASELTVVSLTHRPWPPRPMTSALVATAGMSASVSQMTMAATERASASSRRSGPPRLANESGWSITITR